MGPQNRRDRKHPDAIMKDFRALLDNMQDTTHCMTIYNGTRGFLEVKSLYKTHISEEQLHAMELCICHGSNVEVEGLDGKRISQICGCTGSQNWREGDRQNDWVWGKQRPERCHGALNGHLPCQLQRVLKIKLLNKDGAFVEYRLGLALTTIPENSGNLDPVSKFVQVRKALSGVDLQVFSGGNIVGSAHVTPEIVTSCKRGDGHNERWIVKCHIDLVTWNDVYNK
jgi:hypothetical protein